MTYYVKMLKMFFIVLKYKVKIMTYSVGHYFEKVLMMTFFSLSVFEYFTFILLTTLLLKEARPQVTWLRAFRSLRCLCVHPSRLLGYRIRSTMLRTVFLRALPRLSRPVACCYSTAAIPEPSTRPEVHCNKVQRLRIQQVGVSVSAFM